MFHNCGQEDLDRVDEVERNLMCPMISQKLSAFERKVSSLSLAKDFLIRYSSIEDPDSEKAFEF
jgi:hypothetical protein